MEKRRLRVGQAITPEEFDELSDSELLRLVPRAYRDYFPGKDACGDGFFYLLYAGTDEVSSYEGRGHVKLGLARSRDLVTWEVPRSPGFSRISTRRSASLAEMCCADSSTYGRTSA